jgi:hypothetical protein
MFVRTTSIFITYIVISKINLDYSEQSVVTSMNLDILFINNINKETLIKP